MKRHYIAATFVALTSLSVQAGEETAFDLAETQALISDGKHPEALERFVAFVDQRPAEEGFVTFEDTHSILEAWNAFGETYPPARKALISIRDKQAKQLLANTKGDPNLFADIVAINNALGHEDKSINLFSLIDKRQPNNAKDYWFVVKDLLIKAKQYALVKK